MRPIADPKSPFSPGEPPVGEPEPPQVDSEAGGSPEPSVSAPIDTSARRFRTNVLANVCYLAFNMGMQLWFTRYLIHSLGVATYGLVPLSTSITGYMAIITISLSGSVGRFLTVNLAKGDVAAANRTFNTSLFASITLALALIPVAGMLAWFAPSLLTIPPGQENGTRFLLLCTCSAFLLNAVGSNFACATFAKNRFDVQRLIDATGYLTQVGVILILFSCVGARLWYVGFGIVGSVLVRQACYQISWRKLTPEVRIRPKAFDRRRLREVLGLGGWLTINQLGTLLFLQIDLLVVNTVVGAQATGLYAPGLQISGVLRELAGLVAGVLTPTYAASHALGDTERVVRISQRVVRLLGLAMALPIGLTCGLSQPLLTLWLGERYAAMGPLLMLMLVHLSVNIAVTPLFGINQALNRVKWPGIASVLLGLVNLGLAVTLAGPVGWGVYGVAAAGAIVLTIKNAIFIPAYAAHILKQPRLVFARAMLPCIIGTLCIGLAAYGLTRVFAIQSLLQLLAAALSVSVVAIPAMAWLGMSSKDRQILRELVTMRKTTVQA